MANISKINSLSVQYKQNGKLTMLLLILLNICAIIQPAKADTSIYVFDPNQSAVTQTGGFAGVREIYGVEGNFQLIADFDVGVASFDKVDANLIEPSGFLYTHSLGVLFNMTGLAGIVVDEMTIEFEGKTADGTESDVRLKLRLENCLVHLTGQITPPPNSADMFFYDVNAVATRKYAGGTGEPNEPYLICTAGQLNAIGAEQDDWDKHFKLISDINLQEYSGEQFNIIGTMRDKFVGSFDGAGFTISNFRYSAGNKNFIGLFSQVGDGAQIKDIILDNVEIEVEKGSSVGALVGFNMRGIISRCCVSGSVIGGDGSGNLSALVGFNSWGIVSNCSASGSVTGSSNVSSVGGLVGNNAHGDIYDCMATTTVSGEPGSSDIGGLVGYSEAGTVSNSYAAGNVSGDTSLGGLVGYKNDGSIIQCYAIGDVSGNTRLGGLVGRNDSGIISDCYATGSIDGDDALGGLVGRNHKGSVSYCYSAGTVNGNSRLGGLVGNEDRGSYLSSFWDTDANPGLTGAGDIDPDPNDIFGITTAEMKTASTFLEAGWDFVDETENGTEDVWKIAEGLDYPHLWWEKYGGGTGEPSDPYLIYTPEQMNEIGLHEEDWDKNFKLMSNISLAVYKGTDFNIIGKTGIISRTGIVVKYGKDFSGVFDGNGYAISHFIYDSNTSEVISFFRCVDGPIAEIRDLGLIDPNISAESSNGVGSLVGLLGGNGGTVINCYVEGGRIEGGRTVGGLVGVNGGIISDCRFSGSVSGSYGIGGLVGDNNESAKGTIINCYSTACVSGTSVTGGLVGHNGYLINCCYATSEVYGVIDIGGLIGINENGITSNCYSAGSVLGEENVGGLVGNNRRTVAAASESLAGSIPEYQVINCYSTAKVSGTTEVGGLMGFNLESDMVKSSFWDMETSGQTISAGGIGLTTAEMQMAGTFIEAGWDFVDEMENGTENIWWILEGQDYPRLWWEASD